MAQYLGKNSCVSTNKVRKPVPSLHPFQPHTAPNPTPTMYTPLSMTDPTLYRTEAGPVLTEYPSLLLLQTGPEQPSRND